MIFNFAAMTDHDPIDKKALSERDICTKFITPAIRDASGWNDLQFFEEFTLGKIHVRGKRIARGVRDRADYILFYKKNLPLAIIEAKDNHHKIGAGMQQALRYSEMLDVPFAYSGNGDGFIQHDRTKAEYLCPSPYCRTRTHRETRRAIAGLVRCARSAIELCRRGEGWEWVSREKT
ncbi:MAG TPA: type I restriction endonuclease [Anaerolineales bacterium]|nr:type I restriction endonuclease [Anaerolineales bacterium]